jgi:hypothetical protein
VDFLKVAKGIGNVALSFVPGGDGIRTLINEFLPDEEKLGADATGTDAQKAFAKLPPDAQVQINQAMVDLGIAEEEGWSDRYKAMCAADGQSTRPKIAWACCQMLCFETSAFTVWIFLHPDQMANPVTWTVFAALTAPFVGILTKYFGELRREQGNRLRIQEPSFLGRLFGKG